MGGPVGHDVPVDDGVVVAEVAVRLAAPVGPVVGRHAGLEGAAHPLHVPAGGAHGCMVGGGYGKAPASRPGPAAYGGWGLQRGAAGLCLLGLGDLPVEVCHLRLVALLLRLVALLAELAQLLAAGAVLLGHHVSWV